MFFIIIDFIELELTWHRQKLRQAIFEPCEFEVCHRLAGDDDLWLEGFLMDEDLVLFLEAVVSVDDEADGFETHFWKWWVCVCAEFEFKI